MVIALQDFSRMTDISFFFFKELNRIDEEGKSADFVKNASFACISVEFFGDHL